MLNPFTPSFGRVPPVLAGRDFMLNDILHALDEAGSAPDLCTLYTGPRGMGKTALMLHVAQRAGELGWISASTTAQDGMLEDLYEQAIENARSFVEDHESMRLASVGLGSFLKLEWERRSLESGNWRTRMGRLLEELNSQGVGLLFIVDEVRASVPEMVRLVTAVQHFFGERRKVALLMAGLPGDVSTLISHESVSFLRRAVRRNLELLYSDEVRIALQQTMQEAGKSISADALGCAVEAIGGFPYMMQLVGYRSWEASRDGSSVSLGHVLEGVARAQADFKNGVLDASYKCLSAQDRIFLLAMLKDEEFSRVSDLAKRMGKGASYIQTYKNRLLEQGLVIEYERGAVQYGMPYLREYLAGL